MKKQKIQVGLAQGHLFLEDDFDREVLPEPLMPSDTSFVPQPMEIIPEKKYEDAPGVEPLLPSELRQDIETKKE